MLNKITTILECSRIYALPMTIMAWIIVFTYSYQMSGKMSYGILALIGICLVHLATNIFDDYFDYKTLIKQLNYDKNEYLQNTQKIKCRYLVSGRIKIQELLYLGITYLCLAGIIGLFFYIKCGNLVIYFALIGGFIAIMYSILSKIRMSEIAVGIAYGPALFGGVYYVMTKSISWEVFLLSIPSMFMTIVLLYNHTVMDFDFDKNEGHKTLANLFRTQLKSLVILKWLLLLVYTTPILLCIFDILDWQIMLVYLTIPLATDLYKSMQEFSNNSESIPTHKWYHFPMEDMMNAPSMMIRIYQSRNLNIYYSLLYSIGIILSLK